jgi:ubiquinone/menaquinone biosynthesis C-methylase UbiE
VPERQPATTLQASEPAGTNGSRKKSSAHEDDVSFEPFARAEFYREINKELVERALATADAEQRNWETRRVIDVACGTGAITRIVLDYWRKDRRPGEVVAFDPDASALERAKRAVHSKVVQFVHGAAESLSNLACAADVVLFCNAIHLIEDKGPVVHQVRNALNMKGIFAFNTSFYDGAYAEGSQRFYRMWMVRALQNLRRDNPDLRTDKGSKSMAMQWLDKDGYRDLLAREGFTVLHEEERRADVPLESWKDISSYTGFASGALPGVPVQLSIPALKQAVSEVFDEMKLTTVPRNWFQVVAQRT